MVINLKNKCVAQIKMFFVNNDIYMYKIIK